MSDDKVLAGLRLATRSLEVFCAHFLKIKDKGGLMRPYLWNKAQRHVHERLEQQLAELGRVRALILKGRQQGISTYVGARYYHKTTTRFGQEAFIVAHEQRATDNLYKMVRRYHDHNPMPPSTGATNAKELIFDKLGGGYKLATAGTKDVGRSATAQLLHGSEYGFWANAQSHMAGIGNTIGDIPGTEVILESTGNGLGNAFHLMWQDAEAGKTDFIAIFVPWYWQDEYRAPVRPDLQLSIEDVAYQMAYGLDREQMQWRATKIAGYGEGFAWLFDQEYPACIAGDQRVGTSRGILRMDDVVGGDSCSFGRIAAAWSNGFRPCIRLKTAMGRELVCTPDHKILVEGGKWVRADACVGRRMVLSSPMLASERHVERWCELPSVRSELVVDEDWGRLLGYFMGDGSLHRGCLSIACDGADADVVEDVRGLIGRLIGSSSARVCGSKGGGIEVRSHSAAAADLLERLGCTRVGSNGGRMRKVSVPECIFRSPAPVVREFLRGLFESDAHAYTDRACIKLFSKDVGFLRDVQLLLLALGINAGIESRPARNGSGLEYQSNELVLYASAARLFEEAVGFVSRRKSASMESGCASRSKGRRARTHEMLDEMVSFEDAGGLEVFDASVPGPTRFDASGIVVHNCSTLAFQTGTLNPLVSPSRVMAAVNSTYIDHAGALVIGCDPASDGEGTPDRTAIVFRRGRTAFRVEYHEKLNAMQVAGKLAAYHQEFRPDAIIIDKGGIGAGIYDRLIELNIPVIGIMFAHAADDPERYENKKAEIWWRMREWFEDEPCRIPNNPAFVADICAPQPDVSSNGRKMVEPKNKLEKRQIRSPDGGDALALTFAVKVLPGAGNDVGSGVAREAATTAGY